MIHHHLNQRRLTILLQSKYRNFFFEKKFQTKKWLIFLEKINHWKKNNISFRKKNFLCSNSSKLSNELFEIENASLNVLTSKNINFRINVINIVQEKRVRKSSKDFANTRLESTRKWRKFVYFTQHWWSSSIRKRSNSK
jgi:hypothetical protein